MRDLNNTVSICVSNMTEPEDENFLMSVEFEDGGASVSHKRPAASPITPGVQPDFPPLPGRPGKRPRPEESPPAEPALSDPSGKGMRLKTIVTRFETVLNNCKNLSKDNRKALVDCLNDLRKEAEDSTISPLQTILNEIKDEIKNISSVSSPNANIQVPSYAGVAASHKGVSRPAIVVSSADPNVPSSQAVADMWRKTVSFRDTNFAPARVATLSNKKVRVEFDTTAQRDAALKKMASVTTVQAELARKRRPMVIMKGIMKMIDPTELVPVLQAQNPSLAGSNIVYKFSRRNRTDKLYNAVLEVDGSVLRAMLKLGRLNVDHQQIHVEEFCPFLQCFRCLLFGHTRQHCTAADPACQHCGGAHEFKDCGAKDDRSQSKCVNCVKDNATYSRNNDVRHSATSTRNCPRVQLMMKRISERIAYDD